MFFEDEVDRLFKRMSNSFFELDNLEETRTGYGPYYYGYTVTVGADGKPMVQEYGNIKPKLPTSQNKVLVDTIVNEKEKTVKLVAEMPGVEKNDLKIVVEGAVVNIDAENGNKKYHAKASIKHKIDKDSARANYKNGILELVFNLKEPEKPRGKIVEVQ